METIDNTQSVNENTNGQEAVDYGAILEKQRRYFESGKTISYQERKVELQLLKAAIELHEQEILEALHQDLGKSSTEGYMSEVGLTLSAIDWQIRHLKQNALAKNHLTPIHQFVSSSQTVPVPYGNVLIMAPWNYPFLLAIEPLAQAIAAGNTAIVKTGHAAKATNAVIEKMIQMIYPPEFVCVAPGGREVISELLELKFDYIFFTGGKNLGSLVYQAASKNMTPVTLELGGKSPVVVDESANLALAAKRIVFGKFLNAGQTCVAPDYVIVHESVAKPFMAALKHEIQKQYPNPAQIGKIINESRFKHLVSLVDETKVVIGGRASVDTLQIEPTVLEGVDWDDPIMQEEIFGPILPVLTYRDFKPLMRKLASLPTPLAFYLFTRNDLRKSYMKYVQPFGGGCINDTVLHISSERLPFGGMGASGIGQYHGRYGFETFSHTKGILNKALWIDTPFRYANRKRWMARAIHKIMK
ncbi:MAG: aldehyde dehydrogenase family protein [Erysipelotrichaceae bacterium]|nr:aldehyde dehydrogenase family protein [Erysipelotrichaceae bacterium]